MKVTISVPGRFHLFNLAEELEKRGALERLITSQPKFKTAPFNIPPEKVRTVLLKEVLERGWRKLPAPIRARWNPQYMIHELFDRRASSQIGKPDIVTGGSSVFLHTLRAARRLGAVTVVDHGSSHILYQRDILTEEYARVGLRPGPFQLPHPQVVEKELAEYQEADYICIPSIFVRRTFLERGVPADKIIHVPYGVNLTAFRQIPKADEIFRVIFAGGMTVRKGVHYLLQAMTELNLPNSELLLIGTMNPEMEGFFKKYSGHFRHIGHVPQAELYKYYSQGSIFCLPSVEEGLAMVQPQAMACGLPVIATVNTGGEDIIRNGTDGFIIPIRSVDALKEKILYFYEHPRERETMGASAKARVAAGFTWNDYGEKIFTAYKKILQEI